MRGIMLSGSFYPPLFHLVIFFAGLSGFFPGYSKSIQVEGHETKCYQVEPNSELLMITDTGNIEIQSCHQDSVKIEIIKTAYAKTERKANWILENIAVDVRRKGHRLILRERYEGKEDFSIFDLFDPEKWHSGVRTNKNVDYRVSIPAGMRFRIKHDEGDVSAENLEASFSILIEEGDCRLSNIYSKHCQVEVEEGDIILNHFIGQKYGELKLFCDEGAVRLDSIAGNQASILVDEGTIILKQIQLNMLECRIDEGQIYTELKPKNHDKYDLSATEGDIEIRLLNEIPIWISLYADEGRINSNLDLEVRRSDESERARVQLGVSANVYLKTFTQEGDILFFKTELKEKDIIKSGNE